MLKRPNVFTGAHCSSEALNLYLVVLSSYHLILRVAFHNLQLTGLEDFCYTIFFLNRRTEFLQCACVCAFVVCAYVSL